MMDAGSWGSGLPMMVLWAAVLILMGVLVARGLGVIRGGDQTTDHDRAVEIAKERYAKGEITKEQFAQLKKDLTAR